MAKRPVKAPAPKHPRKPRSADVVNIDRSEPEPPPQPDPEPPPTKPAFGPGY